MKQILLVEDNAGDVLLIRQVISETNLPVKITVARDGQQAIQILEDRQFQPDLIILDLNIPKVHVFLAGDSRTVAGISGGDSLTHAASR